MAALAEIGGEVDATTFGEQAAWELARTEYLRYVRDLADEALRMGGNEVEAVARVTDGAPCITDPLAARRALAVSPSAGELVDLPPMLAGATESAFALPGSWLVQAAWTLGTDVADAVAAQLALRAAGSR